MNATTTLMTTEMSESFSNVTLAVCVAQGGNLISILVSLPLSNVMDLAPCTHLSLKSTDSRKPRKATAFNEHIVNLGEAYSQLIFDYIPFN